MFNLGAETVVEAWIQNPYYQYFCQESEFQWHFPCDSSEATDTWHKTRTYYYNIL
ncbi:MAG: hypothetical protein HOD63_08015 [Bacteroidetes bacterium]|nr:hypothetical protein [Bacteroidota bacterium]MBT5527632.1 hypothetical protein [Cytophagia bacterium]MBT3802355.1 hypothetical protein [Bacteroidota bacterium]MBT3935068.1 hypothetical protein [Bacteroidota bacterium]MBT4338519.1 hypothetical protein [Bacteroidota bacterium]